MSVFYRKGVVLKISKKFFVCIGKWWEFMWLERETRGNRFGFVTFTGVKDKKELEVSMKEVRMGSCKLKVNVARLAVENKEERRFPEKGLNHPKVFNGGDPEGRQCQHNRNFMPNPMGNSYRDTVVGNLKKTETEEKVVEVSGFVKPFEDWYFRSLIVRTCNLTTLVKLDKLLVAQGGPKASLKYVGGLFMLLIFENLEEVASFIEFNSNIKLWFSWYEIWKGQTLPFERIAWLKITGVPLHLVDVEIFYSMCWIFGKVVHASTMSMEVNDLTFDLVGVLTGEGERINKAVSLKWNDRKFRVWVSEEMGEWVSDCIIDVEAWDVNEDQAVKIGEESSKGCGNSPEEGNNGSPVVVCGTEEQACEKLERNADSCKWNVEAGNETVHGSNKEGGGPDFLEEGEIPNFNYEQFKMGGGI
ncbi:hypothetical protein HanOQP8_Chr10g0364821 [Helianthus annuus]|nr:hypothetical protein HanOQP8_Chr10g0364821 [Helianthus annuus]KAJ0883673.1 hypothetical protein HanPSC8_Chr10g0424371 [Helianthus annuus]